MSELHSEQRVLSRIQVLLKYKSGFLNSLKVFFPPVSFAVAACNMMGLRCGWLYRFIVLVNQIFSSAELGPL